MNSNLKKKNTKNIQNETKTKWQQQQKNFDRFEELANRAVEILSKMTNLKQRTTKTYEEIGKYATYLGKKKKPNRKWGPWGVKTIINIFKEVKKRITKQLTEITTTLSQ